MHIFLIGFPRSGKSTLGKKLAYFFKYSFYDTDTILEEKEGNPCPFLYKALGEKIFREKEKEVLFSLQEKTKGIVATGGGIILDKANREFMQRQGWVVYVKTSRDILKKRLEKNPLFFSTNYVSLIRNREDLYHNMSDVTLVVS
jgi:shikimate kinase